MQSIASEEIQMTNARGRARFRVGGIAPLGRRPRRATKNGPRVVEAAKKEGKVVVAGSPDPVMRNDIIPKFTARFGIPIEFIAGRSSQIAARVETERASGIFSIDVYLAGPDTSANELYNDKMIDPLRPLLVMPEVADGSKWKTRQSLVCRSARAIRRARV